MNEHSDKLENQAYQLWIRLLTYFHHQLEGHKSEQLGPFLYRVARLCHRAQARYERRWTDEG